MTRDHVQDRSSLDRMPLARPRRSSFAAAVVVGVMGLVALAPVGGADAARRTKSAAIADAALHAAEALDRWRETHNPVDYVRFVQHRDQAAAMTEADIDLDDGLVRDAWASAPLTKQHVVLNAVSQLGVPYRSLTSKPGVGFDCSGLTIWAFGEAGVELPRVSRDQINDSDPVDHADAVAGDLTFYPGHISIYLGADLIVHSPNSGSHVEVTWLPERSSRFGDAVTALGTAPDVDEPPGETGSLMDRALTIPE